MKKYLIILVILTGVLTSCSRFQSPKDVVEKTAKCMVKGKFKKLVKYAYFEDDKHKQEFIESVEEAEEMYDSSDKDEIFKSFEIIDEEIDEEEAKAEVTVEFTMGDGDTKDISFKLKKQNGKWKVIMKS